jgi:hypothetical protein
MSIVHPFTFVNLVSYENLSGTDTMFSGYFQHIVIIQQTQLIFLLPYPSWTPWMGFDNDNLLSTSWVCNLCGDLVSFDLNEDAMQGNFKRTLDKFESMRKRTFWAKLKRWSVIDSCFAELKLLHHVMPETYQEGCKKRKKFQFSCRIPKVPS